MTLYYHLHVPVLKENKELGQQLSCYFLPFTASDNQDAEDRILRYFASKEADAYLLSLLNFGFDIKLENFGQWCPDSGFEADCVLHESVMEIPGFKDMLDRRNELESKLFSQINKMYGGIREDVPNDLQRKKSED